MSWQSSFLSNNLKSKLKTLFGPLGIVIRDADIDQSMCNLALKICHQTINLFHRKKRDKHPLVLHLYIDLIPFMAHLDDFWSFVNV